MDDRIGKKAGSQGDGIVRVPQGRCEPVLLRKLPLRDNYAGQGLILVTLILLTFGAVMVPSTVASVAEPGPWYARVSVRHSIFTILAAIVLFTAWRSDYRRLFRGRVVPVIPAAMLLAALICGVLVFIPSVGRSVGGSHRWIRIGPSQYSIGFQPSELIKVALVMFLAAWLCRDDVDVRSFRRGFLPAAALVAFCLVLVITQDFGTAVIIAVAAWVTMLLAGVRWYYLVGLLAGGAGAFVAMLATDPRRLRRIEAMFNPTCADNPSAYQLRQALTTIGVGGWRGVGLGMGMMKRGFVPEDSTDCLFAIVCEELGFIGGILLIATFAAWLLLVWRITIRAEGRKAQVLAGSLGFMIALQAAMHVGVNTGLLPPTGIAIPFVSAGGTSLLLMAAATAVIVSISSRRGNYAEP